MTSRIRVENGEAIVEVRISTVDRIFDNRDPAPFRERTLDPHFVEYLVEAGRDGGAARGIRLIISLGQACTPGEIEHAVRAHFEHALDRSYRRRRENQRTGLFALMFAALAVIVLLPLSELVAQHVAGTLGSGLSEALVISGWVLMWRPIEVVVYDGLPYRRERRVLRSLRDAQVEVRYRASTS